MYNDSCQITLEVYVCDTSTLNYFDSSLGHYVSTCQELDTFFKRVEPVFLMEYHHVLKGYNYVYLNLLDFRVNEDSILNALSLLDSNSFHFKLDTVQHELSCLPISFNDPYPGPYLPGSNWHIEAANFDCAWSITRGDTNLIIGFVDGRYSDEHIDRLSYRHYLKFSSSFSQTPNSAFGMLGFGKFDDDDWGTATGNNSFHANKVTGIVTATTNNNLGVTGLTECKAYGFDVSANINNRAIAIYAEKDYLDVKDSVNILNFSMNNAFNSKVISQSVIKDNLVCILSGGNTSKRKFENGIWIVDYSADRVDHQDDLGEIPGCIIVTGLAKDDNNGYKLPDRITSDPDNDKNYQKGKYLDLIAPSEGIGTLNRISTGNHWGVAEATSSAAPVVTSAVALLRSLSNDLTGAECECIIKESAKRSALPISNSHLYPSNHLGAGRLDAYEAVRSLHNGWSGSLPFSQTVTDLEYIVNDLVIPNGVTLTIDGGIVRVKKGVKIIVEAGGKLHLKNNALLTNLGCIDNNFSTSNPNILGGSTTLGLWAGIYVKGPGWGTNYDYNTHGYVLIENSTIENAITAVELGDGMAERGGILIMKNSRLKNCRFGAKFNPYMPQNGGVNFSYFENSEFICDKYLLDGDLYGKGVNTFIWANTVAQINVIGCEFYNRISKPKFEWKSGMFVPDGPDTEHFPFINGIEDRGRAIGTFLTPIHVVPSSNQGLPCVGSIIKPCHFEGFGIAVHALGANLVQMPISIYENQFVNNERNIYLVDAVYPLVINNEIALNQDYQWYRQNSSPPANTFGIGIRLNDCQNFIVADNLIDFTYEELNADLTALYTQNCGYQSSFPWLSQSPTKQSRVMNNTYNVINSNPNEDINGTATFIDGTNVYTNICNEYSENWDFGWYTHQISVLDAQQALQDDGSVIPLFYDADNDFQCATGFSAYSIEAVVHANSGPFGPSGYAYPYLNTSPWGPSCNTFQFSSHKDISLSPSACPQSGGKYFSRQSLYCPGPDGIPGTADDNNGPGGGNEGHLVFHNPGNLIFDMEDIPYKWLHFFDSAYADLNNIITFGQIHFDNALIDDEKTTEIVSAGPNEMNDLNQIRDLQKESINFYPNPGNGSYHIDLLTASGGQIEVINTTGQVVLKTHLKHAQTQLQLDAPSGIYYIKVSLPNGQSINRRFVHLNPY